MIKIVLIIAFLIIFFLTLALVGQLDDICEYEKKIKEAREFIKNHIIATETEEILLEILGDANDN